MATILVVDDNASNRDLLRAVLGPSGHVVIEASDGAEALELTRSRMPDVVVADVLMPRMDGYELVRRLRSDAATAGASVIFYTAAYAEAEVRRLADACGVRRILLKPSEPQAILAQVEGALAEAPQAPAAVEEDDFHRQHLVVLNEKLIQQVRELETANRDRQRLLARIVGAQELERRTIAEDIHDDSIQVMTAVAIRLEVLGMKLREPAQQASFAELADTVRSAINRLRHLMFRLWPPALETEGLGAALEGYLEQGGREAGYQYRLDDGLKDGPLPELRILAYRIAQEALVNVAKHAEAGFVEVALEEREGGFLVRIADDGQGFDQAMVRSRPGHLGVSAMRERAEMAGGWLQIRSAAGCGTVVEFWIPGAGSSAAASDPRSAPASPVGQEGGRT